MTVLLDEATCDQLCDVLAERCDGVLITLLGPPGRPHEVPNVVACKTVDALYLMLKCQQVNVAKAIQAAEKK